MHVVWPAVAVIVTGLLAPVVVVGAFLVAVDRKAKVFRASCAALMMLWVDIRMLAGCWALGSRHPDRSDPAWRREHEKLLSSFLDSLMFYARRWLGLDVRLTDRMHFGAEGRPRPLHLPDPDRAELLLRPHRRVADFAPLSPRGAEDVDLVAVGGAFRNVAARESLVVRVRRDHE